MDILQFLLIGVEVVISILLVLIILVQKTKSGGGLGGSAFGGGGAETIFGSRAGNVLTKATIILGIAFMLNTLFLAVLFANKNEQLLIDSQTAGQLAPAAPGAPSTDTAPPPAAPVDVPAVPEFPSVPVEAPAPAE